jgi:hypothetical protein
MAPLVGRKSAHGDRLKRRSIVVESRLSSWFLKRNFFFLTDTGDTPSGGRLFKSSYFRSARFPDGCIEWRFFRHRIAAVGFCRTDNIIVSSARCCMTIPTDAVGDGFLRLRSYLLKNRSVDDGNTVTKPRSIWFWLFYEFYGDGSISTCSLFFRVRRRSLVPTWRSMFTGQRISTGKLLTIDFLWRP